MDLSSNFSASWTSDTHKIGSTFLPCFLRTDFKLAINRNIHPRHLINLPLLLKRFKSKTFSTHSPDLLLEIDIACVIFCSDFTRSFIAVGVSSSLSHGKLGHSLGSDLRNKGPSNNKGLLLIFLCFPRDGKSAGFQGPGQ